MSRIKSKETTVERIVFSFLRKSGIYFQKHYSKAPGRPDIALPKKKKAIFIDGDFWHGYHFRAWQNRVPKKYWHDKIKMNMNRDRRNNRILKRRGWAVLRLWEHEVMNKRTRICALSKIKKFVSEI